MSSEWIIIISFILIFLILKMIEFKKKYILSFQEGIDLS